MFLRFHNMLTDRLRQLNPRLSDEDLYQGVRRFMGAISQIMTYRDILPVLLGIKKKFTQFFVCCSLFILCTDAPITFRDK